MNKCFSLSSSWVICFFFLRCRIIDLFWSIVNPQLLETSWKMPWRVMCYSSKLLRNLAWTIQILIGSNLKFWQEFFIQVHTTSSFVGFGSTAWVCSSLPDNSHSWINGNLKQAGIIAEGIHWGFINLLISCAMSACYEFQTNNFPTVSNIEGNTDWSHHFKRHWLTQALVW